MSYSAPSPSGHTVRKQAEHLQDITTDELQFAVGGLSDSYDAFQNICTVEEAIERVVNDVKLLGFCYKGGKKETGKVRCLFKYYGAGPNTDPEWCRYSREDFFGDWSCTDLITGSRGYEFHSYRLSIFQGGLVAVSNDLNDQTIAWRTEEVPPIGKSVLGLLQDEPDADGPCWIPCDVRAASANLLEIRVADGRECKFRREYNPPLSRYRTNEMRRTIAHKALGVTNREKTQEESDHPYNVIDSILYFIPPTSCFRIWMVHLMDHVWFDRAVLIIIALNTLALVLDDPLFDDVEWLQTLTTASEVTFQVLFTIEMCIKILALGFILHPGSYLQSYPAPFWNRLDFLIVIAGYIGLAAGSGSGFPALRLLRCLRPLRTLNRVRELRQLMSTLSTALPLAIDIFLLFFLLMWVFSILGIQLFSGDFHRRCYIEPGSWNVSHATYINPTDNVSSTFPGLPINSSAYDMSRDPTTYAWLVFNDTDNCGRGRSCESNGVELPQECTIHTEFYKETLLTFDNIFTSLLLTFKLMSLDDWPDDMKDIQDVVGHHAWIYFFFCTLLGNVIAVNLILAMLSAVYSYERENRKIEQVKPVIKKLTATTFLGAVTAHPIFVVGVPFMVVEEQATFNDYFDEMEDAEVDDLENAFGGFGSILGSPRNRDHSLGNVTHRSHISHISRELSRQSTKASKEDKEPIIKRRKHYNAPYAPSEGEDIITITTETTKDGLKDTHLQSRQPTPVSSPASKGITIPQINLVTSLNSNPPYASNKTAPDEFEDDDEAILSRMGTRRKWDGLHHRVEIPETEIRITRVEATEGSSSYASDHNSDSDSSDKTHISRRLAAKRDSINLDHSLRSNILCKQASDLFNASVTLSAMNMLSPGEKNSRKGSVSALDIAPVSEGDIALQMLRNDVVENKMAPGMIIPSTDGPVNLPGTPEERLAQLERDRKRRLRRVGYYKPGTVGHFLFHVTKHRCFNIFILLVTVINIVCLAMDHYKIDETWLETINIINFVCVCIFFVEAVLKLIGQTPTIYFSDNYNIFDFILVLLSIPELVNPNPTGYGWGGGGLSALRGFRLGRVFRLAKKWKGLNRVLTQISDAIIEVAYLGLIVILFLFCFSVLGMRQFRCDVSGERCYFENLGASSLTVFIVLTGENWATMMEETLDRSNWFTIPYFVTLFLFGNYILLNLLIAILIDSFQPLDEEDDNTLCCCKKKKDAPTDEERAAAVTIVQPPEEADEESVSEEEDEERSATEQQDKESESEEISQNAAPENNSFQNVPPLLCVTNADLVSDEDSTSMRPVPDSEHVIRTTTDKELTPPIPDISVVPPPDAIANNKAPMQIIVEGEDEFRLEIESATTDDCDEARLGCLQNNSFRSTGSSRSLTATESTPGTSPLTGGLSPPATEEEKRLEFRQINGFLSARKTVPTPREASLNETASSLQSFRKTVGPTSPRRLSTWKATETQMKRTAKPIRGRSSLYPNSELAHSKGIAEVPYRPFESLMFAKFSKKSKYDSYLKHIDQEPDKSESFAPKAVQNIAGKIVNWRHFEKVVILVIMVNLIFIAIDCPYIEDKEPSLYHALRVGDYVFVGLFSLEMILKILAWGLVGFFSDKWNGLDAFVVATSIVGLFVTPLRSFRSLRVLRIVTIGNAELKVVLQSVLSAMPAIQHVIFVSAMVWFVFAVVGVSLFKGALYECSNPNIEKEENCSGMYFREKEEAFGVAYEPAEAVWRATYFSFDDVLEAMFSLFQIAVGEKWRDMLYRTMDAPGAGEGPRLNANYLPAALFYVAFIVLGQFFFFNLFIGVLIQSFAIVKEKCGGRSALMTEAQLNWLQAQRVLLRGSLREGYNPEPEYITKSWILSWVHFIACSKQFEAVTTFLICLNSIILAVQHYDQSHGVEQFLWISNWVFTILFTIEALIKITAFSVYYFSDGWNRFDFLIVLMSWVGTAIASPSTSGFRVLRVGRMLRLLGRAEGLKTIVATMMSSLPSLMNISVLLLVNFFIFGVFGVDLFGRIEESEYINRYSNFENLYHALVTLYQVSTTETWNDVMEGTIQKGNCDDPALKALDELRGVEINCHGVSEGVARAYFVLFLLLGSFIFLNLFIYVLIEHFEEEKRAREFRTKTRDLEAFDILRYEWIREDPSCTGFVGAVEFIQLLQRLPEPLWLSSPFSMGALMGVGRSSDFLCTQKQLRSMLIPLDKNMRVRYSDVVKTLSLKVFGININQAIETQMRAGHTDFDPSYWNIHHYHAVQYVSMKWRCYRDTKRYAAYLQRRSCPMRGALRKVTVALTALKTARLNQTEKYREFVASQIQDDETPDVFTTPQVDSISIILAAGVYTGEQRKGRQHGKGILAYANNGGFYKGEWKDGSRFGKGIESKGQTIVKKGFWEKNMLHGEATFGNVIGGYVFKGTFEKGLPKGSGTIHFASGVIVKGHFDGAFCPIGEGEIILASGSISGMFERHGKGPYSYILLKGERDSETKAPMGKIECILFNGDRCTIETMDGSLTGEGELVVNSVTPQQVWRGAFHHGTLLTGEKNYYKLFIDSKRNF